MNVSTHRRRERTYEQIDANPTWTAEDFKHAVKVENDAEGKGDVMAAIEESMRRRFRGAQKRPTKAQVTLRVEREALARYRAMGRGWQSRLSADISAAAKRLRRPRRTASR
jgi:uncharacterized protein (DUF4415 family)